MSVSSITHVDGCKHTLNLKQAFHFDLCVVILYHQFAIFYYHTPFLYTFQPIPCMDMNVCFIIWSTAGLRQFHFIQSCTVHWLMCVFLVHVNVFCTVEVM